MRNTKLEVWKDTEVEPKLTTLYEDELHGRTLNNSNEARVDIRIGRVFRLENFQPQHPLLSQQIPATVSCYE